MDGILRRTYTITRWADWDDEIHAAAEDFHTRFSVWPNILLASEVTQNRIDMAGKKDKLRGPNGETAPEHEYTPIGGFIGPEYELDFFIDDKLAAGSYSLLYDSDPGDDGEPVPEEDTSLEDEEIAHTA